MSHAADPAPVAWKILGPFDLPGNDASTSSDAAASSPLTALLAQDAATMEAAGSTLWWEGEPFRWFAAREDPDGAIWVRHQFGSARQGGNTVFLFARLSAVSPRDQAIEIDPAQAVDIWLDSRPVAPVVREGNRGVWIVRIDGENAILVRSRAPRAIAPWRISIRFREKPDDLLRALTEATGQLSPVEREPHTSDASGASEARGAPARLLPQRDGIETSGTASVVAGEEQEGSRPWKIRLPPDWTPSEKRVPLLVALPYLDETPDDALQRQADLVAEAGRRGWIVLAPFLPPYGSDLRYRIRPIEIARAETMETHPVDPARVYLLAQGDSAETGLSLALLRGEEYAGAAFIEGRWTGAIPWESLLLGRLPRPALFFASRVAPADPLRGLELRLNDRDGPWLRATVDAKAPGKTLAEALDFLSDHPFDVGPLHVLASNRSVACERSRWLCLREAQNLFETASLSADRVSSSVTILNPENVAQFDVLLADMSGLDRSRTVTFRMGRQRLQVFPRVPDVVRCSLVTQDEGAQHWQAETVSIDPDNFGVRERATLSELKKPLPAWPAASSGGVAGLLARAARQATRAQVALLPADGVFSGQDAGSVHPDDLEAWFLDSELCTATISTANLLRVLEFDYAGPRFLASDGVGAVAAPRQLPAEEPGADTARGVDGGTDRVDGMDEADTSKSLGGACVPLPVPSGQTGQGEIVTGPVFQSSALPDAAPQVVVASWKGWFERSSRSLGLVFETTRPGPNARPTAQTSGPVLPETKPPARLDAGIHDAGVTQRAAILKLLDAEPALVPPPPSVGGLPVKEPVEMKKWAKQQ